MWFLLICLKTRFVFIESGEKDQVVGNAYVILHFLSAIPYKLLCNNSNNNSFYFQAIKMLSDNSNSIPIIFLITDGAVEDERNICDTMRNELRNYKNICPRIYTLGIGMYLMYL